MHVGNLGGAGAVGVDDDELGSALFPGLGDVGHHIDLGRDRVAAPDDDQVGFRDLPPVDAALGADPNQPAGIRQSVADRRVLARVAHRMTQTLQPVALHQPHGAGIEMRPHRFAAVALGGARQPFGDQIERVVPRDRLIGGATDALVADPAQRHRKPLGMVLPLGIAADLGADHAVGVALRPRTANAADPIAVNALDLERTGARTIVRADAIDGVERQIGAPARGLPHNTSLSRARSISGGSRRRR